MRFYCSRLDPQAGTCRLTRLAFPSQPALAHGSAASTSLRGVHCLVSVPCPHPCSGFPGGGGVRAGPHPGTVPKAPASCRGCSASSCPSARAHRSSGGGWGALTALELERRRGDQSCSSSEPSGDPLHHHPKAQREGLQPLGTPVPLASHSSCLCVRTHLCFLGHLLRGPGEHVLRPPPAPLLTPSKYLCQPWAAHGRAQWHAGEREGRS